MNLLNTQIIESESTGSQRIKIMKDKCNFLYKIGKPFTLIKSGSSYELISNFYNEKAFRSGFSPKDLSFIKSVKTHVNKNNISLDFIDEDYKNSGIDYIKVSKFKSGDVLENLHCIDIDSAYWKTALNLGIISESIYKRGLDAGKVVRLAGLGSLAKKKDVWVYDGKDFNKLKTVRCEYENLWFAICKKVSDVMSEVVKEIGDDFVFYWVDGIYVKRNEGVMSKIIERFQEKGYSVHSEFVPKVSFHDNGFTVQGVIESDVKEFSYNIKGGGKKNTPITDYIENKRLLSVGQKYIYGKNDIK